MICGLDGRKLSKSHGSTELRALRADGWTADDVWATLLPLLGLDAGTLSEAIAAFQAERIPAGPFTVDGRGRIVAT